VCDSLISITSAYRKDCTGSGGEFSDRAADWLRAALAIEAETLPGKSRDAAAADAVARLAARAVGDSELRRYARLEWNRDVRTPFEALYLFAAHVEHAGALELADAIVALVPSAFVLPVQDVGRFTALRGRISRKRGLNDFARDQYLATWRMGVTTRSDELRARAALGLGTLAQRSGNYPEMVRFARRAARFAARAQLRFVEHEAHRGQMTEAAKRGDFGGAIVEAWRALECAGGDPALEAVDRQSLGQLLLEVGDHAGARKLLIDVLRRGPRPQVTLAALGSLAVTAANTRDDRLLEWVFGQVDRLRGARLPLYELASTLLECAQAASIRGWIPAAASYRDDSLRIALDNQFHEFAIKAESLALVAPPPAAVATVTLGTPARKVIRRVAALKPSPLPRRLSIGAATSR